MTISTADLGTTPPSRDVAEWAMFDLTDADLTDGFCG